MVSQWFLVSCMIDLYDRWFECSVLHSALHFQTTLCTGVECFIWPREKERTALYSCSSSANGGARLIFAFFSVPGNYTWGLWMALVHWLEYVALQLSFSGKLIYLTVDITAIHSKSFKHKTISFKPKSLIKQEGPWLVKFYSRTVAEYVPIVVLWLVIYLYRIYSHTLFSRVPASCGSSHSCQHRQFASGIGCMWAEGCLYSLAVGWVSVKKWQMFSIRRQGLVFLYYAAHSFFLWYL